MKYALALAVLLSSEIAWGDDKEYSLQLTEMSVEYFQYESRRDAYFPTHGPKDWVGGSKVRYTLGALKYFYWSNELHFSYDNSPQVREGGWAYEIGVKPFKWLDVYKSHHSRHSFEQVGSTRFPVEDAYGFRLNLIN